MIRSRWLWSLAIAGFAALLLYLTVASTPAPPPTGVEHSAAEAENACQGAVRGRLADASFPFAANVTYEGDARYRMQGTVETVLNGERVRRNYECVIRYAGAGSYRADSLRVWQSH